MKRIKLLLLLALLMTAATGAWGMQIYISYPSWPTGTNVNGDGNLVLEMEASDSFENMKAKIEDKSGLNPDYMKLYFNSVEMANNETLNAKGVTSNSVLTLVYTLYNVTTTYSVDLNDGELNPTTWKAKAGDATEFGKLPLENVAVGQTVTLKYAPSVTGREVKSISATVTLPVAVGHALTIAAKGEIIASDGKAYAVADKDFLASGVTAVALVVYKNGSNGLALALQDDGYLQWDPAVDACISRNTSMPITGAIWQLPTKEQWETMFGAAESFPALRDGFSAVGETNMNSTEGYWSATENPEYTATSAWAFLSDSDNPNGGFYNKSGENSEAFVRAVLAW